MLYILTKIQWCAYFFTYMVQDGNFGSMKISDLVALAISSKFPIGTSNS